MEILWKGTVCASFRTTRPKLCGNYCFPQNFHIRKLVEITVFSAVQMYKITDKQIIWWSNKKDLPGVLLTQWKKGLWVHWRKNSKTTIFTLRCWITVSTSLFSDKTFSNLILLLGLLPFSLLHINLSLFLCHLSL